MVVDVWLLPWLLAIFLSGAGSGVLGARLALSALRRRVLSLEFDVGSLEERLLREVKTRASAAGVKARKEEGELLEKLMATPPKAPTPWWTQYVSSDLKG